MRKVLRGIVLVIAAFGPAAPLSASKLEDALGQRWRGAWVLLEIETRSDCGENYTNNEISGKLSRGNGSERFAAGELGQVYKVDVKRNRIDLLIELSEPLLVSFVDGPFELFREAYCKIELEVQVPRELIKGRQTDEIDALFTGLMERHATSDEALSSDSWNGRRVEPFPADYDRVLAAYDEWKLEQLQGHLADALSDAERITDRVESDVSYAQGFAEGMRTYSPKYRNADCASLADASFYPGSGNASVGSDGDSAKWNEGYREGQLLAWNIDRARAIERCLR